MFLSLFCERHSGRLRCVCCVYAELVFKIFAHNVNPFRCRIFLFRLCLVVAPGAFLRPVPAAPFISKRSLILAPCCSFSGRARALFALRISSIRLHFHFPLFPHGPQVGGSSDAVRFVTDDAEPFIDGALFGFVCFVLLAAVCPRSWQAWPLLCSANANS